MYFMEFNFSGFSSAALVLSSVCVAPLSAQHVWKYDFESASVNLPSDFHSNFVVFGGSGTTNDTVIDNHGQFVGGSGAEKFGTAISGSAGLDYSHAAISKDTYNLSASGSSLTIDMWWITQEIAADVNPSTAVNDIFQIGLSNGTTGTFENGLDSAFVGVRELSSDSGVGSSQTDYVLRNESGALSTLAANKTTYHFTPVNAITAAYRHELTFTNQGGGLFMVNHDIEMWEHDAFGNSFDPVDLNFASWSASGIDLDLGDLTALHPTLGIKVADSAEISVSGYSFDSDVSQVPEPSGVLLGAMALGMALVRRR